MFKITSADGHTYVGNNEDNWSTEPKIWFEQGETGKYGAAYVGHRRGFAQGGMNEKGLVYDGLTLHHKPMQKSSEKLPIGDSDLFLKKIMQECANIEELQNFISQYNVGYFSAGMFLFVDKSGDYLTIAGNEIIYGNDPHYILSNFRPADTPELDSVKIKRYQRGRKLLSERQEASMTFTKTVMDTMSECRGDLCDGTLYTSAFDLEKGDIYLWFYHDYQQEVKFNLADELAKGNHSLEIPSLFPPNAGFQKLQAYKTPQNSGITFGILSFAAGMMTLIGLWFFLGFFKNIKRSKEAKTFNLMRFLICVNNALLIILIPILLMLEAVFYFGIEGSLGGFPLKEVIYFPILIALFSLAIAFYYFRFFEAKSWSKFSVSLLQGNLILYTFAVISFIYWGILLP